MLTLVFPHRTTRSCRSNSHCELLLLQEDPAREGVCAARSIHPPEPGTATLSFSAHSMMHGALETLNMMGGLTSTVWSKDLPTCSFDTENSGTTCREAEKMKRSRDLVWLVWLERTLDQESQDYNTTKATPEKPHPGWLEARVHGDVRNVSGFHAAQNIPNNPICRKNIIVNLESQNIQYALQRKPTVVTQELLARLLGAIKWTTELEFVSGTVCCWCGDPTCTNATLLQMEAF